MKVDFTYILEDYIEICSARDPAWRAHPGRLRDESDAAARVRRYAIVAASALFCVGAGLMLASSVYLSWRVSTVWLLPFTLVFFFTGVMVPSFMRNSGRSGARRLFASHERSYGPMTIEVDEDGIHALGNIWQVHLEWGAIRSFFRSHSIWVIVDDTPQAFIFPRRAFADEDSEERFCRFIREHIADAALAAELAG